MRTYDIPYVKQSTMSSYPAIDYKKLSLKELVDKYIKVCGKADGKVSVCSKCQTPCEHGKRALQLLANETVGAPVPLYGGKTLIERAREEAAAKRAEASKEEKKPEKPAKAAKNSKKAEAANKRNPIPDWYDRAYESPEPLEWIMKTFGLNKTKARQKVYAYQYSHPGLRESKPLWEINEKYKKKSARQDKPETPAAEEKKENKFDNPVLEPLEAKINKLMQLQDEYKKQADYYQKLYVETKGKVDALFEALNILNEN